MKRGLKVFIGLACFCLIGLPIFAQPSSRSIETFVLDNFDNPNGQDYAYGSKAYNWDWSVNSSRFHIVIVSGKGSIFNRGNRERIICARNANHVDNRSLVHSH